VLETALRLGVTVYDAAYISLAESLGVDFYTADEKLLSHTNAKHITQYKRPRGSSHET
jgi:predicted nucleic acid-binding protein